MAEVAAHHERAKTPPRLLDLCLFTLRHHPELAEEHVPKAHLKVQSSWPRIISSSCGGVFFSVAIYLPVMENSERRCCCNPNSSIVRSSVMYVDKERSGYAKSTEVGLTAISRGFETRLIADLPYCPSGPAEIFYVLRRAIDSPMFLQLRRRIIPGPMRPTVALYVRVQGIKCTYARRHINGYYFANDNLVLGGPLELGNVMDILRTKFEQAVTFKVDPLLTDTPESSDTEYESD